MAHEGGWRGVHAGDAPVRLNKFLAQSGLCSRREADALIASGLVRVAGEPVEPSGTFVPPGAEVAVLAAADLAPSPTYVLNKPVGFVSAQPEAGQTPAARLLTAANRMGAGDPPGAKASLPPLGRLDQDSRGLLLLSQDGPLAKAIIGPASGIEKEYLVAVAGQIAPGAVKRLRFGLSLDGKPLKRAEVDQTGPQILRFVLTEGRKRQIRRMCRAVGLEVTDLLRVRIGPLSLGELPEGRWRLLAAEERAALIAAAGVGSP